MIPTGSSGQAVLPQLYRPTGNTATLFVRGSNQLMMQEADRSLHDSLCVIRSIVKKRAIIAGGAAGEIEVAMNGQQALDVVDQGPPVDLILMDMMMPVLDGFQATRELKQKRQVVPPVIAVTAHAMRGDREKCLAAGADDYLPKPVATDDLVRMLHKWLEHERRSP